MGPNPNNEIEAAVAAMGGIGSEFLGKNVKHATADEAEANRKEGTLRGADAYWAFLGTCTQCGQCTPSCPSLIAADMTLGDIAKAMLAAQRESETDEDLAYAIAGNPQLVQAVRGCFFCNTCKNTCFAHNDVDTLIYNARVDFQKLGLIPRYAWSSVLVDQEWDIFTAYRAIYGIYLGDLTRHVANDQHDAATDCEVAFMPGCSLAAYAPDLTREIFGTLDDLGGKTTLIDHCCGSPLKSAGFFDRAEALCDKIADEVRASGAKTMVCVCPGCANAMKATFARNDLDVDIELLAGFLAKRGFKPKNPLPDTPLCLSKSCQDRDGTYLNETCDALGISPDVPSIFHGCCGAGGAVSAFDPNRQAAQADSKLSFAEDGSTVVTMCPTCTYTYASMLLGAPRDVQNKHYAELLFENQIDWQRVFAELQGMYEGEYGPWLNQVFA